MKLVKILPLALIALLVFFLSGCYPDKIDYVDEYDLAATHVLEDADFSNYLTFAVIDTVMHVSEDGEDDPNLSRDNDDFIINEIRTNMLELGYIEDENPDTTDLPDLVLAISAVSSDYYYYYGGYCYYWYWYYCPGWGYPVYAGSYTIGTLVVDIWDTEAAQREDRNGIIWTGFVDGILSGNSSQIQQRLDKQINQLFAQSPYMQQ
jgi:hypothetical protein